MDSRLVCKSSGSSRQDTAALAGRVSNPDPEGRSHGFCGCTAVVFSVRFGPVGWLHWSLSLALFYCRGGDLAAALPRRIYIGCFDPG